jgi:hypothetical protein
MMEQKITDTLNEMGKILSNYFAPSDQRLYALERLQIKIIRVHHVLRKSKLSKNDRADLTFLLNALERYNAYYEIDGFSKYYVQLFIVSVSNILSDL